jgi:hypothetical protein
MDQKTGLDTRYDQERQLQALKAFVTTLQTLLTYGLVNEACTFVRCTQEQGLKPIKSGRRLRTMRRTRKAARSN